MADLVELQRKIVSRIVLSSSSAAGHRIAWASDISQAPLTFYKYSKDAPTNYQSVVGHYHFIP